MSNPNHCAPHKEHRTYLKNGFMNIYRSGWFHREGKPVTFDRHPGDIYPTREEALKNIEPVSLYIDTTEVSWVDQEDVQANHAESVPMGLAVSRTALRHNELFPELRVME